MKNKTLFRQSGGISLIMSLIIISGIAMGSYYAHKKGYLKKIMTVMSAAEIASQVNDVWNSSKSASTADNFQGYGIQLVATSQLDQAKNIMNDFARDGYSAYVLASNHQGRTFYKVRLGPYHHKPEAVAIKDKVIRRYPNNPYVKSSLVIYKPN